MYTFNDWIRMEQVGRRAFQAARLFADGEAAKHLGYLEHALAEMRHVAGQLGESRDRLGTADGVIEQDDLLALDRLKRELFHRPADKAPNPADIHGSKP